MILSDRVIIFNKTNSKKRIIMRKHTDIVIICLLIISLLMNGIILYKLNSLYSNKKDASDNQISTQNAVEQIAANDEKNSTNEDESNTNDAYKDVDCIVFLYDYDASFQKRSYERYIIIRYKEDENKCSVGIYEYDGTVVTVCSFSEETFFKFRELCLATPLTPLKPISDNDGKIVSNVYPNVIEMTDMYGNTDVFCPSNMDQIKDEVQRLIDLTLESNDQ